MKVRTVISGIILLTGLTIHAEDGSQSDKLCVMGDFVRMRSMPQAGAKIVRNLFWNDRFDTSERIGSPVRIGQSNDYWYKVSYQNCQPPECANTQSEGYVYGKFLENCQTAKKEYDQKMNSSISLKEKLLYRRLFNYEMMLPDGKSSRRNNEVGGCCAETTYTTSYFSWEEKESVIEFHINYDFKSKNEASGEEEKEKYSVVCRVSGIQKNNDGSYILVTDSSDKHCRNVEVKAGVNLGKDGDFQRF